MTPFPYSIDVEDTSENASKMMADHDIHHLPVTDKGKPVGVISDLDIRRSLEAKSKEGKHRVGDIANLDSYIVDLATPLDNVVLEMADRHIATALVVRQGRLVGIFTANDAFSYLGRLLNALFPRGSDDAA